MVEILKFLVNSFFNDMVGASKVNPPNREMAAQDGQHFSFDQTERVSPQVRRTKKSPAQGRRTSNR
jgi:hypothetical protein